MSFIVIDGPNGSGKTTLIKTLALEGIKTLSSPNGTPLAQMIRPACRGTDQWQDLNNRVKFMLFSAARLDEYIRIVKDSKEVVVADRWWTSTYVYQCCLEGIDEEFLQHTIHPNEKLDLVILLDATDDVLIDRMKKERETNTTHGNCTWTQNKETIIKIANIYRNELPKYLKYRTYPSINTIKCIKLDTTNKTEDLVKENVINIIEELGLNKPV